MLRTFVTLLAVAPLLGGCGSLLDQLEGPLHSLVDKMPEWAGGPPKNLPPRPGDPGYAAYQQQVEGRIITPVAEQGALAPLH
ncbi:MAG TPA: hypothetical protein VFB31_13560 [Pseudolabrys sp.]|nr:hypothetical protein [Pseudolabrys sp.]